MSRKRQFRGHNITHTIQDNRTNKRRIYYSNPSILIVLAVNLVPRKELKYKERTLYILVMEEGILAVFLLQIMPVQKLVMKIEI